ncbi:hypothetical protein MRX96_020566 [Rhipicephalus microplus]
MTAPTRFCCSQVLVEFDNADWKRREWIRVYEDPFAAFLVEETLTWHVRNSDEPPSPALVSVGPPPCARRMTPVRHPCPPHHGALTLSVDLRSGLLQGAFLSLICVRIETVY